MFLMKQRKLHNERKSNLQVLWQGIYPQQNNKAIYILFNKLHTKIISQKKITIAQSNEKGIRKMTNNTKRINATGLSLVIVLLMIFNVIHGMLFWAALDFMLLAYNLYQWFNFEKNLKLEEIKND